MSRIIWLFLVIAAVVLWQERESLLPPSTGSATGAFPANAQAQHGNSNGNQKIHDLFAKRRSKVQVQGVGTVTRVLADDATGSKHQRFILSIGNGHTVLVAHNIDLAPRVPNLREGDRIAFYGQYEYSNKGGVIHWTHHDPRRRHEDGWLEKNGYRYK